MPIPNKIKTVDFGEIEIFFNDKVGTLLTSKMAIKIVKYGVSSFILKFIFNSESSKIRGSKINIPQLEKARPQNNCFSKVRRH